MCCQSSIKCIVMITLDVNHIFMARHIEASVVVISKHIKSDNLYCQPRCTQGVVSLTPEALSTDYSTR